MTVWWIGWHYDSWNNGIITDFCLCAMWYDIFKYYMRDYSKSYHMTFSSSQILPQCMANCHTQAELWIWIFMVQHNPPECCPCYSLHHSSHHNISMQPITILLTLLRYGRLSLADTRLCRPITACLCHNHNLCMFDNVFVFMQNAVEGGGSGPVHSGGAPGNCNQRKGEPKQCARHCAQKLTAQDPTDRRPLAADQDSVATWSFQLNLILQSSLSSHQGSASCFNHYYWIC